MAMRGTVSGWHIIRGELRLLAALHNLILCHLLIKIDVDAAYVRSVMLPSVAFDDCAVASPSETFGAVLLRCHGNFGTDCEELQGCARCKELLTRAAMLTLHRRHLVHARDRHVAEERSGHAGNLDLAFRCRCTL